jgi:hypothetical protein
MALKIRILRTTGEGQDVLGTFFLGTDGAVATEGPEEHVLRGILLDDMLTEDGAVVIAEEEPEEWLKALPRNLTGSYLKAEVVNAEE